jgi:toxin ParE1/3/4
MTKTYTVIFKPRAEQHLDNLYAYIAEHSGEARADDFVGRIVDTCMNLSMFPERGTKRDDIRPNLRTTSYARRVMIAYAVDHDTNMVAILGVFYGGQDFEQALVEDID